MAAAGPTEQPTPNGGFAALWRFLPMLWPAGETGLKARVIVAVLLVLAGKAATLLMPFAYKAVIDGMSGQKAPFAIVAGLVAGYATARFAGVL
jgi:ATP-binding cassette subfamily B protein